MPDEMSGEEFAPVWEQLVALRPNKVVFTGGEPLLRPDLVDLLLGLRSADVEHHVLRCLNTNGHLVTPQLAQRLVGLADEVRVSIDALADRNDALRGPGNFDAALKALECLRRVGFEPKALVTVTAHSLPDLEDLLCLLAERGITQVNLNGIRMIGRGRRKPDRRVDPTEVDAAANRAWTRCGPDRPPPLAPTPTARANCGVGRFLNIMPNGDVFPCHALVQSEYRCGNLREDSLLAICDRGGLLGRLASLDLAALSRHEAGFTSFRGEACLGEIYSPTTSSHA